jgi:multiple sugar transport system substrate-binding protein
MSKRVVSLAIAAVLVFSLSCGSLAAVKISLLMRSSSPKEVEYVEKAIELFEAQNDNVEVELVLSGTGGGNDYVEKLTVLRASGLIPDLFQSSADKLGYMMRRWTLDLTPYFERDKAYLQVNDFLPGTLEAFKRGGRLYGLPTAVCGQSIFYNVDMFNAAGLALPPADWNSSEWTWDSFVATSRKLTLAGPDGRLTQVAVQQLGEYHLPDLAWIFGGDWFSADTYETNVTTASTLDRAENVAAWKAAQEIYLRGWAADRPDSGIDPWGGYMAGKIAMDWIGWWKSTSYAAANITFDWAMAPMPKVVTRNHTLWTDTFFISAETKHPQEAWEFLTFMASREMLELRQQYGVTGPTRRSALGAYIDLMSEGSAMTPSQVSVYLNGAVAHGRTSLEQSVYGAYDLNARMLEWLPPMIRGQEAVETTIARIKPLVDGIVAEYAKKAQEVK